MIKQKIVIYESIWGSEPIQKQIEQMNSEGWVIKNFSANYGNQNSNYDPDTITVLYEKED